MKKKILTLMLLLALGLALCGCNSLAQDAATGVIVSVLPPR